MIISNNDKLAKDFLETIDNVDLSINEMMNMTSQEYVDFFQDFLEDFCDDNNLDVKKITRDEKQILMFGGLLATVSKRFDSAKEDTRECVQRAILNL